VCCVGVDEMSVRKGHEYISVFADLVKKRVLFATEGKDQETWLEFVEALEKHNGHRHALTQVRHGHEPRLPAWGGGQLPPRASGVRQVSCDQKCQRGGGQGAAGRSAAGWGGRLEALYKSQWLWRKNPENLTDLEQARLAGIKNKKSRHGQSLSNAAGAPGRLPVSGCGSGATALPSLVPVGAMGRTVFPRPSFASMVKLAQMIETHLAAILAALEVGLTNAFMEGLNSVFSATKRKARGYRFHHTPDHHAYFTRASSACPNLIPPKTAGNPILIYKMLISR